MGKEREPGWIYLRNGLLYGTGWALGATLGFALVITLTTLFLKQLGGLPVVGEWFAAVIDFTNQALEARKALGR